MKYVVSDDALDDLLAVWEYTSGRWGEARADLYMDALTVRFAWLTRNTGLWQERSDLGEGIHSYPERSHVIVFRQTDRGMEIVRVLHGRMDPERHTR
jgi:toxin ParE1/3/4